MSSEYAVKNIRRDLERLNIHEIRELAKERGFSKKDAKLHGNAQKRATWVKLLLLNDPEFQNQQPQEKPQKHEVLKPSRKPAMPVIKQRVVHGLRRLPEVKTTIYSYKGVKQS